MILGYDSVLSFTTLGVKVAKLLNCGQDWEKVRGEPIWHLIHLGHDVNIAMHRISLVGLRAYGVA